MLKKIRRLLPHGAILICNMYIVFFLIDRVNQAMNFIDNSLTKGLLLILCVISFINIRTLLSANRGRGRRSAGRSGGTGTGSGSPLPGQRPARDTAGGRGDYARSYDGYTRRTTYAREGDRR